jgi:hypothetical protein
MTLVETHMTLQAALELVMAWLPNQLVDLEAISGIEITDVVPQNQTTWAITGSAKPASLAGFGERVVDQAGWQAFCRDHRP